MTEPIRPASGSALPEGSVVDRYELRGVIHADACGIVYAAWDRLLELQVAVTEYLPASWATRDAALRLTARAPDDADVLAAGLRAFIDEARRLSGGHHSWLRVWRFWEDNGTAYMVKSLPAGMGLTDTLRRRGAPPDEAWLKRLLDGLMGDLDRRDTLHPYLGDIHPGAIWVSQEGHPRLLESSGHAREVIAGMRPDFVMANLPTGYAAPEASLGTWPIGEARDVYALAAVIRFAVTGETPASPQDRGSGDVPLATLAHGRYSARFLEAIDRAWRLRPDERTPTFSAFRADLGLEVETPPAMPDDFDGLLAGSFGTPSETAAADPLGRLFAPSAPRVPHEQALAPPSPAPMEDPFAAFAGVIPAPAASGPQPLMFGTSAPRTCVAGSEFSVVFMAYVEAARAKAIEQVRALMGPSHEQVLDAAPDGPALWRQGTPFTVRVSGRSFSVDPPEQTFAWSGSKNIVTFAVRPLPEATGGAVLSMLVLVEGIVIASLPLHIAIEQRPTAPAASREAALRAPRSVFASYASKDAQDVAGRLSTLTRWAPSLDIFQDCLDLRPNEAYKPQLSMQIAARDAFLLFWSRNAAGSNWVRWEFETALATKPRDAILPMPLEDPAIAPPPPELDDLHFRDRFMLAGYALGAIEQERRAPR
jgi:hypothetical protein